LVIDRSATSVMSCSTKALLLPVFGSKASLRVSATLLTSWVCAARMRIVRIQRPLLGGPSAFRTASGSASVQSTSRRLRMPATPEAGSTPKAAGGSTGGHELASSSVSIGVVPCGRMRQLAARSLVMSTRSKVALDCRMSLSATPSAKLGPRLSMTTV
jgi:hypothetical protein